MFNVLDIWYCIRRNSKWFIWPWLRLFRGSLLMSFVG